MARQRLRCASSGPLRNRLLRLKRGLATILQPQLQENRGLKRGQATILQPQLLENRGLKRGHATASVGRVRAGAARRGAAGRANLGEALGDSVSLIITIRAAAAGAKHRP